MTLLVTYTCNVHAESSYTVLLAMQGVSCKHVARASAFKHNLVMLHAWTTFLCICLYAWWICAFFLPEGWERDLVNNTIIIMDAIFGL